MLRQRIRELERQVNDLHANSAITHEPVTPSNLTRSTSVSEETAPLAASIEHFTSEHQESTEEVKED